MIYCFICEGSGFIRKKNPMQKITAIVNLLRTLHCNKQLLSCWQTPHMIQGVSPNLISSRKWEMPQDMIPQNMNCKCYNLPVCTQFCLSRLCCSFFSTNNSATLLIILSFIGSFSSKQGKVVLKLKQINYLNTSTRINFYHPPCVITGCVLH